MIQHINHSKKEERRHVAMKNTVKSHLHFSHGIMGAGQVDILTRR